MAERNALAELAERLETHIVPVMGCVGSTETGRAIAADIHTAQRIIAELAKVQEEEAALHAMENITAEEARRIVRQREGNCILKCRAIAEEGAKDAK